MGNAIVMKDARVEINSVVLSGWVKSLTINYGVDVKETTAMGDNAKTRRAGLLDWSAEIEFNQDYNTGGPYATLMPLMGVDDVAIKIRPTSEAISATNPEFQGVGILENFPLLDGSVGDVSGCSVTFQGSGVLTVDITP